MTPPIAPPAGPPPAGNRPDAPPPPPPRVEPSSPSSADPTAPALVRRTGDRVLAGVAAALGRRWGIDPVLVRILFVLATFAAGVGVAIYAILWVSLPLVRADAPPSPGGRAPVRGAGFWVGVVVVLIGGGIALAELPAPRILLPVALITLGIALWQRPGTSTQAPGANPGEPPDPATSATGTDAVVSGPARRSASTASADPWSPPPLPSRRAPGVAVAGRGDAVAASSTTPEREVRWWVPPRPRRRPSWLGPVTIAVAMVATGVVALLGEVGILAPTAQDLLAVALLVLGGGMVVGAVRGHAKWLAWPAMALAGLVAVGGIDVPLRWLGDATVGEQHLSPGAIDGTLHVDQPIGLVTVDLTDTDLVDGDTVAVAVGVGDVRVLVPDDVDVDLTGEIRVGDVETVAPLSQPSSSPTGVQYAVARLQAEGSEEPFAHLLPAATPTSTTLHLRVSGGLVDDVEVLRGVGRDRLLHKGGSTVDLGADRGFDDLFVPAGWERDDDWYLETGPARDVGTTDVDRNGDRDGPTGAGRPGPDPTAPGGAS